VMVEQAVLQGTEMNAVARRQTISRNDVAQLKKTDSPIPPDVSKFFVDRGTTYHQFKQDNWHLIAEAHRLNTAT